MPRPTKLTNRFLKVTEEVVEGEGVMFLTDEELLFLVNEELSEKERISTSTFEKWKAGKFSECTEKQAEIGQEFLRLIKKALMKEKQELFRRMQDGDLAKDPWVKYAWILERKFKEWNLKALTEVQHSGKVDSDQNITFQVVDYAGTSDAPKGNAKSKSK